MPSETYLLDDGRRLKYWLGEWTNDKTDTTYYVAEVTVYERRRRLLTLGLTKKWKRVSSDRERHIDHNDRALREELERLRAIVLGEVESPLENALDKALREVEPNHNT